MKTTTPEKLRNKSHKESAHADAVIRGLYRGLLGRDADVHGLAHWIAKWEEGADLTAIVAGFTMSDEFETRIDSQQATAKVVQLALDEFVNLQALLTNQPLTIVDIGAQNLASETHIYAPICKSSIHHKVIGFEPLLHRIKERLAQEKNDNLVLLPAFIGDGDAHTFHINAPDSTSSLLPFNESVTQKLRGLDSLYTVHTEPAQTATLDSALIDVRDVDLIKLDIQGAELMALRNATETLRRTLVVHCEVSFSEIYKGQPLFSEVEQHMRAAGFDLVDLYSLCRYSLKNSNAPNAHDWLGWGDAVFFRRLEDTAHWRDWLVQSLIALLVYKKPSLASNLAGNLATTPAAKYLSALQLLPAS